MNRLTLISWVSSSPWFSWSCWGRCRCPIRPAWSFLASSPECPWASWQTRQTCLRSSSSAPGSNSLCSSASHPAPFWSRRSSRCFSLGKGSSTELFFAFLQGFVKRVKLVVVLFLHLFVLVSHGRSTSDLALHNGEHLLFFVLQISLEVKDPFLDLVLGAPAVISIFLLKNWYSDGLYPALSGGSELYGWGAELCRRLRQDLHLSYSIVTLGFLLWTHYLKL